MAWGPYRFTVPNYSVETIRRSVQPRVEPQPVIGATPPLHKLGPGNEVINLESTFHPHHFNKRGLTQLAAVRQAVNALTPLPLVHINGNGMNIFGMWTAISIDDEETIFDTHGTPCMVVANLSLMREDPSPARSLAIQAAVAGINFSLSLRLGF
ncbi:putative Phage P2 GpU [Pseudorhizobium banfieldiae]|uniref:Putative Phage P2 GpU n=1 Tax=Pseudorhizobium banfieldiae TaxID=1125847 RepID=L0NDK6_9HYPH|nr:phage tail protein [Pseudorhizobium banfieldiae]CCF19178.1 putative Phage P2 GpU [Pseudorhizobium banfieldiae]